MTTNSIFLKPLILIGCIQPCLFGCTDTRLDQELYLKSLCKESGYHIYRIVEGVSSIYQMRPPEREVDVKRPPLYIDNRWVGEQPYWNFTGDPWTGEYPSNFLISYATLNRTYTDYLFFEGSAKPGVSTNTKFVYMTSEYAQTKPCASLACYNEVEHHFKKIGTDEIKSQYGYTWKEITPKYFSDRIVGAEWRVIDLKTGEVLAYARNYRLFPKYEMLGGTHGAPDRSYLSCMQTERDQYGEAYYFNARDFVSSVLRPPITIKNNFYKPQTNSENNDKATPEAYRKQLDQLGGGDCSSSTPLFSAENYYLRGKALVALNDYKSAMVCLMRAQELGKETTTNPDTVYTHSCSLIGALYKFWRGAHQSAEFNETWPKYCGRGIN